MAAPGVELLTAGGAGGGVDAERHAAQVVAVQVEQPARRARGDHLALQRVQGARGRHRPLCMSSSRSVR
jgi:hypothetical protein